MATKRKKKKASKRTVSKKKSAKRAPRPAKRRVVGDDGTGSGPHN
jgi:hypothetical protein